MPQTPYTLTDFTTQDDAMRRTLELARVAARTDLPVLILGESGTGKTMLARAIHASSSRAAAPWVSFNAAALSDTLLDSQLFGHEKGAFTGASRRVKGKFELAHGGTLFIDEIADMSAAAQAKILRAVEYGEFERLGSETLQEADVRLLSATHLPIRRFLDSESFRRDLFYRISGLTIDVPPLRERPADLRALVGTEIAAAARAQKKTIVGLSRQAAERLFAHHWPGNLRELQRVVHTAVALSAGEIIQPADVLLEQGNGAHASVSGAALVSLSARAEGAPEKQNTPELGVGSHHSSASNIESSQRDSGAKDGDLSLRAMEERHIRRVMEIMDGCKRRTARALGLSRSTLDRKLASFSAPSNAS